MGSKSIDGWTKSHGLSRGFFYVLKKRGQAPQTFKVGRAVRISDEANDAWVKQRQADSFETESV